MIDSQKVDDVISSLTARNACVDHPDSNDPPPNSRSAPLSTTFSRTDIFKRIEEDRERHKRLRERRWVQPISHNPSTHLPQQLASFMQLTDEGDGDEELTIDIEFENEWETTSDWNEDDDDAAAEESELCFPTERAGRMDVY